MNFPSVLRSGAALVAVTLLGTLGACSGPAGANAGTASPSNSAVTDIGPGSTGGPFGGINRPGTTSINPGVGPTGGAFGAGVGPTAGTGGGFGAGGFR